MLVIGKIVWPAASHARQWSSWCYSWLCWSWCPFGCSLPHWPQCLFCGTYGEHESFFLWLYRYDQSWAESAWRWDIYTMILKHFVCMRIFLHFAWLKQICQIPMWMSAALMVFSKQPFLWQASAWFRKRPPNVWSCFRPMALWSWMERFGWRPLCTPSKMCWSSTWPRQSKGVQSWYCGPTMVVVDNQAQLLPETPAAHCQHKQICTVATCMWPELMAGSINCRLMGLLPCTTVGTSSSSKVAALLQSWMSVQVEWFHLLVGGVKLENATFTSQCGRVEGPCMMATAEFSPNEPTIITLELQRTPFHQPMPMPHPRLRDRVEACGNKQSSKWGGVLGIRSSFLTKDLEWDETVANLPLPRMEKLLEQVLCRFAGFANHQLLLAHEPIPTADLLDG